MGVEWGMLKDSVTRDVPSSRVVGFGVVKQGCCCCHAGIRVRKAKRVLDGRVGQRGLR
jgi:hypothetical protein